MKIAFKTSVSILFLSFMFSAGVSDQIPLKIAFVSEAEAIVGAPLTPVSAAGVARRTTRRVVATEAAVATTTASAASSQQQATAQQQAAVTQQQKATADCGGVFYKAAFQGNNLVYVVVEKPLK